MSTPDRQPAIDELLDRAFQALNDGDRSRANMIANQVLTFDEGNAEAGDLLAAPVDHGEIRRLTIMFADVVDSTVLSTMVEPEVYRTVVGRYREIVQETVARYEGHIASTKGDGLLAVFGHPVAHENDVERAVKAGLEINRAVADLNDRSRRRFGIGVQARVGIHRGLVYLDIAEDDVYGLAANLASRLSGLAEPNTLVVSEAIEPIIRDTFEVEARQPKAVKGITGAIAHFRVIAEREAPLTAQGPLVGRHDELAVLTTAWEQTVAGTATSGRFALRGDAGIGKSRLAAAVVDTARESGAVVLELTGSPFHTDVGLRPVRRLIERRNEITPTLYPAERIRLLDADISEIGLDPTRLLPLLAPVLDITPQSGYRRVAADGRKLYEEIAAAVQEYLLACVAKGPALLLVEDLHWFDEDTLEIIEFLSTANVEGLMVIMTGRDEAVIPGGTRTSVLDLKPFTEGETDQLIQALHPDMATGQRKNVHRRCDGVPLYIEEVVAKLKERPADTAEPASVPDSLYEALFARLRSSGKSVKVVEAAATIGTVIDRALLLSVLDLDEHDLDIVIRELTDGRVLKQLSEDTWRFRHELLREVAAELSPPSLRRRVNGRIADALVAAAPPDGSPDWRLVASRYEHAERYSEAAHAYQQAAAGARLRGALGESRNYLTHAVTQIERAARTSDRDKQETSIRLERGFLAYAAEGASSPNAAVDFERCLALSGVDLRSDELFSTLTALYGYYAMRADLDRVETLLESVRLNMVGREFFKPFNEAGFGMLAWYRGHFGEARELLEGAAAAKSEDGFEALEAVWFMPNEGTASIYTHLALARAAQADLVGAEAELVRTANRCDELGFPQGPFSLAYALQMEVLIRLDAGQMDLAADAAARLIAIGEQHGFDSWTLVGTAQLGFVSALSAAAAPDLDSATLEPQIAMLIGVVEMWRALGVNSLITIYEAIIAQLQLAVGQRAEARARLDAALDLSERTGMRCHGVELLRIRAQTHDDDEGRARDLDAALALAREQYAFAYELRCATDAFQLDSARYRIALEAAVARCPAEGGWPELARARALLG